MLTPPPITQFAVLAEFAPQGLVGCPPGSQNRCMKRILYASGGFFTDDAIADALMEYASVLAIVDSADLVSIPGVDDGGKVREIMLIVGPASQLVSMSSDAVAVDLNVEEAVQDLHQRIRQRLPSSIGVGDARTSGPAETDAESTSHESG